MDLEPCSRADFDIAVIRYAGMDGWRAKIVSGQRCEGYVDGRLVLRLERRGIYAAHFKAHEEPRPHVSMEGFRYR